MSSRRRCRLFAFALVSRRHLIASSLSRSLVRLHSIPFDSTLVGGMSQSMAAVDHAPADSDAPPPADGVDAPDRTAAVASSPTTFTDSTLLAPAHPPSLASSSFVSPLLLSPCSASGGSPSARSVTLKLRVAGLTRRFRVPFHIDYQQLCKEIATICKLQIDTFRIHYSVSQTRQLTAARCCCCSTPPAHISVTAAVAAAAPAAFDRVARWAILIARCATTVMFWRRSRQRPMRASRQRA